MDSEIKHTTKWDTLQKPVHAAIAGNVMIVVICGLVLWPPSERYGNDPLLKAIMTIGLFVFCNGLLLKLHSLSDHDLPNSLSFGIPLEKGKGAAHYESIARQIEAFLIHRRIEYQRSLEEKVRTVPNIAKAIFVLPSFNASLLVKIDIDREPELIVCA